ncbi:LPXTG cell wall anchor domain-containing protein [Clostridium sp. AF20-17LB]|nr:LPXTG cell wall anchor domain-containing protein [Clostridium sp. AF20-17LB]
MWTFRRSGSTFPFTTERKSGRFSRAPVSGMGQACSPTRYHNDSDDDDWDPTPNKKPTITTAADETVTITDAETQPETRVEESTAENETETSTETTVENEKKLPQTGQLWWPVGILLSAGAILLVAGLVMKKRSKEK